jgi:CxxC motif-containing protein (DUF1111 family)
MRNLAIAVASILIVLAYSARALDDSAAMLSASAFTTMRTGADAYVQAAPALGERQHEIVLRGRAHFNRPWVIFGITGGDWGLGPTFIADRCSACHAGGGRGAPPTARDEQLHSMLVRVSVPGNGANGAPKPDPHYGDQLQNRALRGQSIETLHAYAPVPAEAELYLDWEEHSVAFADGETIRLRKPKLHIEQLAFGPLGADVMLSLRNAPPIFGLGLLQAVPEETLLDLAARQRAIGLNGRPNYVWDAIDQRRTLGRFGWKANQPSVRQQIAVAAWGDMGVTSSLFPRQNCTDVQTLCRREVPGNDPELADSQWDELELWTLGLAAPARRNWDDAQVQRGARLFEDAGCAHCHVPTLTTADMYSRLPQLSKQTLHAYTDLLLHDMGEALSDGRPDFEAGARDWRTPPLWGLGLSERVNGHAALLHDGRARNAVEAILWHGGEALAAREAFRHMTKAERAALIEFLQAI